MCPAFFDTGFVVREPAWHGLATVLDEPQTAAEALVQAGQDWSVSKAPVFAEIPGHGSVHIPDRFATYRDDTNAPLGVVGDDWTAVQNADAFGFMDELVGGGELVYETAGVLEGGRKVFMLARMPDYITVGGIDGEQVSRYILCCNGHAGTLSFKIKMVDMRVVCSNTLNIALGENGRQFVGRHTSGIENRVRQARDLMDVAFKRDELFEKMVTELLAVKMSPKQQTRFVEQLIPVGAKVELDSQAHRNAEKARTDVLAILRNGEDLENIRGTAYGALQAAIEYADWHTRVVGADSERIERRFKRNWMREDPIKLRALAVLAPAYAPRGADKTLVEVGA